MTLRDSNVFLMIMTGENCEEWDTPISGGEYTG